MSEISYQMASWPEEDELVAELLVGEEIVGFVRRIAGEITVTVSTSFESTLSQFSSLLSLIGNEFSTLP